MFCRQCGQPIAHGAAHCESCGVATGLAPARGAPPTVYDSRGKSRIAAGILGILLGHIGVHRFYLGYVGIGILQIIVTVCTLGIGGLWGFIEGIIILTGGIQADARGVPLRD